MRAATVDGAADQRAAPLSPAGGRDHRWWSTLARRYPAVTSTLVVGLLGIVLVLAGAGAPVPWVFSVYALGIVAWQAVGMVRDVLRGRWGLDVLAVTSIVATVLVGEPVAALLVVLMLTGGEALEDFANGRAKRELDALLVRAPRLAHRVEGHDVVDVRAEEVRPGDVLLVRPSEVVPVDATLRSAQASVDQSSLTGESVPASRGGCRARRCASRRCSCSPRRARCSSPRPWRSSGAWAGPRARA